MTNLPHVDKHVWLNKHYTKGRNRKIRHITRHHLAGIGDTEDVWGWWQTRAASAHFVVEQDGAVGQLVREADTAWSNANSASNNESVTIEHANSGGAAADWPISDATIRGGAKLAAELCMKHNLGRPKFGTNIRDHREWASTSCPHHLANGNKYHGTWMRIAQEHYDHLATAGSYSTDFGGLFMSLSKERQEELAEKIDRIHHELTHEFQTLYKDENGVQSTWRGTLMGFILQLDRKVEDIHANMLTAIWSKLTSPLRKNTEDK